MSRSSNRQRSSSGAARSIVLCRAAPAAGGVPGPLTEEQLRKLGDREADEREQALGDAWRGQFSNDLEGLYDYVSRCARGSCVLHVNALIPRLCSCSGPRLHCLLHQANIAEILASNCNRGWPTRRGSLLQGRGCVARKGGCCAGGAARDA